MANAPLTNRVSVITVNFNQPSVTEDLLNSILKNPAKFPVDILVVDNGSDRDMSPTWNERYPEVNFLRSPQNLGFAGGNNLAVSHATGEYLFFVNNDTEFTPGLLERLTKTLDDHPEVGMISPKIRFYHQPSILQYAGFTEMNFFTCRNRCIGEGEQDEGQYDQSSGHTAYIHGAAMMVRRTAIEKAGLMAENFFLYYEEIDWCERVKKAGFDVWFEPRALIYHKESVSVGRKSQLKEYFMNRNRILFIRKNAPASATIIFLTYFVLLVVPRNLIAYIVERRIDLIPCLFKAIWWNLSNSKNSINTGFPTHKIR